MCAVIRTHRQTDRQTDTHNCNIEALKPTLALRDMSRQASSMPVAGISIVYGIFLPLKSSIHILRLRRGTRQRQAQMLASLIRHLSGGLLGHLLRKVHDRLVRKLVRYLLRQLHGRLPNWPAQRSLVCNQRLLLLSH